MADIVRLWLGSYARLVRCLLTCGPFGLGRIVALAVTVPLLFAVQTLHWMALLLDEVLFPRYRHVRVEGPVFIVGMPRSGTSFLQGTLAGDGERFTTAELWELLLAPSIVQRKCWRALAALHDSLGRPLARLLSLPERVLAERMRGVHGVDLHEPGEDFLFLLPAFACFLLVVVFPTSPAVWELTRIDSWPDERRRSLVRFYHACLQRHLYADGAVGRVVLSKNPSFTACVDTLHEVFADARFLCCFRDPAKAIPSQLSSLRPGASLFGYDPATAPLPERFIGMYEHFARRCAALAESAPDGTVGMVPFRELTTDVERQVREIYRAFGWEISGEYARRLSAMAARARGYRTDHEYDLAEFGLSGPELATRFEPHLSRLHELAHRRQEVPA